MSLFTAPSFIAAESDPNETHSRAVADLRICINMEWLVKLRWASLLGQSAAILAVLVLWRTTLPLFYLAGLGSITVLSNLLLMGLLRWQQRQATKITEPPPLPSLAPSYGAPVAQSEPLPRRLSSTWMGGIVLLDMLILASALALTGGTNNPFHFLYVLHVVVAAMTCGARWAFGLTGLSIVSLLALQHWHIPLIVESMTLVPGMALYRFGLMVAYVVCAVFIVVFVQQATQALLSAEIALASLRAARERQLRLHALATLAAGAAHELSTPLATIAVVAKELERMLLAHPVTEAVNDARLIRQEVERCRSALMQLSADAGANAAESFVPIVAQDVLDEALEGLWQRDKIQLAQDSLAKQLWLCLPKRSFVLALRGVLKNALEASAAQDAPVMLAVRLDNGNPCFVVRDYGSGVPLALRSEIGQPFISSKAPGVGMGLGLFLARTLCADLGGQLVMRHHGRQGTEVVMAIGHAHLIDQPKCHPVPTTLLTKEEADEKSTHAPIHSTGG